MYKKFINKIIPYILLSSILVATFVGYLNVPSQSKADTAPTLVDAQSSDYSDTGNTETTASISWIAGDIILVFGSTENNDTSCVPMCYTLNTPTATGLSFSLVTSLNTTGTSGGDGTIQYLWSATAGGTGSGAISATRGDTAAGHRGISAFQYRGSSGIGTPATIDDSTAKVISVTRSKANSLIALSMGDWAANADVTVDPSPAGGTQRVAVANGAYTAFVFNWGDQGAAGTTDYGITAHTGTVDMAGIAVEIFGTCDPSEGTCVDTFSTPGYTTFTVPTGVNSLKIACWGGGGNGFDGTTAGGGAGGGGGAFASSTVAVSPSDVIRLFIGSAGSGSGGHGATSTASTTVPTLLVGADGGRGATSVTTGTGRGGLASISTGDVSNNGGSGGIGVDSGTQDLGGGGGGAGGPNGAGGDGEAADTVSGQGGLGGVGDAGSGGTAGARGNTTAGGDGGSSTNGGGGGGGGDNGAGGGLGGSWGGGGGGGEVAGTNSWAGNDGACTITYAAAAAESEVKIRGGGSATTNVKIRGGGSNGGSVKFR